MIFQYIIIHQAPNLNGRWRRNNLLEITVYERSFFLFQLPFVTDYFEISVLADWPKNFSIGAFGANLY